MNINEVITYDTVGSFAGFQIQQGMNFDKHNGRHIFLMSDKDNSKYEDSISKDGQIITYEGHDQKTLETY